MILCFAENQNERLTDTAREVIGAGRALADKARCELAAVALGAAARSLVASLGEIGADRVFVCEEASLDGYAPEASVSVLAYLVSNHASRAVLFPETSQSYDLAVRLAAKLRVGFAPRCTALSLDAEGRLRATRAAYSEKLQATVVSEKAPLVVTLQQGVGEAKPARRTPQVEEIALSLSPNAARVQCLQTLKADPRTVPLNQAEFIVSGGNGVRDFSLLWELADRLGAAVGGSRVVCDDGRLPRERQIGESGTTVTPRCYVAFGISGASQHLRGMQDSKLIIAINQDRYAPLMKLANMAVVADAEEVIRAILSQLAEESPAP